MCKPSLAGLEKGGKRKDPKKKSKILTRENHKQKKTNPEFGLIDLIIYKKKIKRKPTQDVRARTSRVLTIHITNEWPPLGRTQKDLHN